MLAVAHVTGEDARESWRRGFVLAGPENSGLEPECLLDVLLVDLPETGTVDWDALSGDSPANGTSANVGRGGRIMRSNRRDWSGWMWPDRRGAEELLGVFDACCRGAVRSGSACPRAVPSPARRRRAECTWIPCDSVEEG